MTESGIGVGVHYIDITRHQFYREKFNPDSLRNAIEFGSNTVSIPMSPKLTDSQVDRIIDTTKKLLTK